DHNRPRDHEENRVLGIIRKTKSPKLLVVNKIDRKRADYSADYAFYEREFSDLIKVSALKRSNFNILLNKIFAYLPTREPLVATSQLVQPALNLDSKLFIAEIIREKVFLNMREEVPYTVTTKVDQVEERSDGTLYIKGEIITTADRYKVMLIGHNGVMIKEIGMAVRKELETASGKKVYVDLNVVVNPRWQEE
ncbi:MAG: KH domain-containing protein, partial [Patescibacteria group bacterium]